MDLLLEKTGAMWHPLLELCSSPSGMKTSLQLKVRQFTIESRMRLASRDSIRARASMSMPRSSSGGSRSATAEHLSADSGRGLSISDANHG